MNKKTGLIVGGIVLVIISFLSGSTYGQSKALKTVSQSRGNFSNNMMSGNRGMKTPGGFTSGEILSIDSQSMTVKMRDGGSKIIFYTDKTAISKMADGSVTDLTTGKNISITGTANTDGSISATSIQVRPIQQPNNTPVK